MKSLLTIYMYTCTYIIQKANTDYIKYVQLLGLGHSIDSEISKNTMASMHFTKNISIYILLSLSLSSKLLGPTSHRSLLISSMLIKKQINAQETDFAYSIFALHNSTKRMSSTRVIFAKKQK